MPEPLLPTAEVLRQSGVTRQRFYNYIDIGLIHEAERTPGGRRHFAADVLTKIRIIQGLQELGYSLRDIRETFAHGFAPLPDPEKNGPPDA